MKRPQHMTMRELIELPVVDDRERLVQAHDPENASQGYGGAFKDENGLVWGTLRLATGWVRYPAYLSLLTGSLPGMAHAPAQVAANCAVN